VQIKLLKLRSEQISQILIDGNIVDFAIENTGKYQNILTRAESLVSSEVLKLKMCKLAAEAQGYRPEDIHGFVELVPMGDAEIIRLQYEEDHAYMQ
jgi:intracellular sulfur oxidation DsrE/DsrF family protein